MHLTPDQIDDHLIGDLAAEAEQHLALCADCQQQVAAASAPLASFQAVSLAWSERRSATLPTPAPKPIWGRRLAWASAVTAALLVGVVIPSLHHTAATPPTAEIAIASTGSTDDLEQAQQIADDNKLLRDIDAAIAGTSDSPATLGIVATDQHRSAKVKGTI